MTGGEEGESSLKYRTNERGEKNTKYKLNDINARMKLKFITSSIGWPYEVMVVILNMVMDFRTSEKGNISWPAERL
jgi:hypothetical protein